MVEQFISKDIINDLENITGKSIENINEKDLNNIKRLTLIYKKSDGTDKDYNLVDLFHLKEIESITLSRFMIDDEDIKKINLIPTLKFINFDFCSFNIEHFSNNPNIESLVFNVCKTLKMSMLNNSKIKNLKIIGSEIELKEIDILNFGVLENLEELSIHNFIIKNISKINKIAPRIQSLNLDGSKIDNNDGFNLLGICVSNRERFFRADLH